MRAKYRLRDIMLWIVRELTGKGYATPEDGKLYDHVARKFYKRDWVAEQIADTFSEFLPSDTNNQNITILDKAAGTGIVSEALLKKGFKVRASDINRSQLELLKSKYLENLK